jgi:hypothetical protein
MYPCPCCGYQVFSEPPGSYEICPICFWEDDNVQLGFPDLAGGANSCSLIEGQKNFATCGVCELRFKNNVRSPRDAEMRDPSWRPLDPDRDRYLHWSNKQDHARWRAAKDDPTGEESILYYWLPQYWLRTE